MFRTTINFLKREIKTLFMFPEGPQSLFWLFPEGPQSLFWLFPEGPQSLFWLFPQSPQSLFWFSLPSSCEGIKLVPVLFT